MPSPPLHRAAAPLQQFPPGVSAVQDALWGPDGEAGPETPLLADVPASFAQHLHYHALSVAFLMVKRSLGEETREFPKLLFPIH